MQWISFFIISFSVLACGQAPGVHIVKDGSVEGTKVNPALMEVIYETEQELEYPIFSTGTTYHVYVSPLSPQTNGIINFYERTIIISTSMLRRSKKDIKTVVRHELGHALGFKHSKYPCDIMYYAFRDCQTKESSIKSWYKQIRRSIRGR